jgi:hypothetical protein
MSKRWIGLVVLLAACRGAPVATVELPTDATPQEVHFVSKGKPVALWSDTDGKWTNTRNMPVDYDVEFLVGGKTIGRVQCDGRSATTRVCRSEVSINSEHSGNCEVKMHCAAPTLPAGDVVVRVTARRESSVSALTHRALVVREE